MLWRRNLEGEVEGEREGDRTGEMEGERLGGVWAPGLCNRGGLIVGFGSAMVTRPSAVGSVIECGARLRWESLVQSLLHMSRKHQVARTIWAVRDGERDADVERWAEYADRSPVSQGFRQMQALDKLPQIRPRSSL